MSDMSERRTEPCSSQPVILRLKEGGRFFEMLGHRGLELRLLVEQRPPQTGERAGVPVGQPVCTAPGFLDTSLGYAAWRSSYSSRASRGVR